MQQLFIIAAFCLALSLAYSINPKDLGRGTKDLGKDPKDERGGTTWKVEDPGIFSLKHEGTIFENDRHRFDGAAVLSKNFADQRDPWKAGGRLDYNYLDSKAGASLQALNAGRFGTQVGVEGTYNLYKDRNSAFDVGVKYDQSFGGQFGRSEPMFVGFLRGTF